jgi:serine/threonine-protein kinase RsbW
VPTSRQSVSGQVGAYQHGIAADSRHYDELRPAEPGQLAAQRTFTQAFPGCPDQIKAARAFTREALSSTPVADDAVLICSELATNAVLHSRSGLPDGQFFVTIGIYYGDHVWIEVRDQGGQWTHNRARSGGRGLVIVGQLASRWDITGNHAGRAISARLNWPESRQRP